MSTRSVLARVFLALALVLNGIGGAMAGTRMHLPETGPAAHAGPQEASEAMPCHGGSDAGGGEASAQHDVGHGMPAASDDPAAECCQGACTCACMAAAQAMQPALAAPAVAWASSPVLGVLQVGHPAPAVPHLIRPPIG